MRMMLLLRLANDRVRALGSPKLKKVQAVQGSSSAPSRVPARVIVYAMLFLMTAISYLDRVNLSVAAGPIAKELGLSPVQLGWLFSGFLWTYIVALRPQRRRAGGRLGVGQVA